MKRVSTVLSRRAFVGSGTLVLAAAAALKSSVLSAAPRRKTLQFGLITDLHHADKPAAGSRYYRETRDKLSEAGDRFRQAKPSFLVELGDLIDAADSVETEQEYLATIDRQLRTVCEERHYVLGNHCVDMLTKTEFLQQVGQARSYYSFDRQGLHFVVLDACYRSDGEPYGRKNSHWTDTNIPPEEVAWLRDDLAATSLPTIVFAHQRLDVSNKYGVKNAAEVRAVLSGANKVLAVFQGHSHRNDLNRIGDIPYCTLVAMVEGSGPDRNGYSLVSIDAEGTLQLTGFREQKDYHWPATE